VCWLLGGASTARSKLFSLPISASGFSAQQAATKRLAAAIGLPSKSLHASLSFAYYYIGRHAPPERCFSNFDRARSSCLFVAVVSARGFVEASPPRSVEERLDAWNYNVCCG